MSYNSRPLLFPLLGLIVGIYLVRFVSFSISPFFVFGLVSISSLLFFIFRRSLLLISCCSFLLFVLIGFFISYSSISKIRTNSNLLSFENGQKSYLIGRVESPCEKKEEGESLVLKVLGVRQSEQVSSAKGKLLLKVGKGNCIFKEGDIVQTYLKIKSPDRFNNFDSFDYPFYLLIRKITATGFVENENFIVKIGEERSFIESHLVLFREKIENSLAKISNQEAREILFALLLGSKKELSSETEKIFQQTGTTHLLVVSGFHLTMVGGFCYFLIRAFFSLFPSLLLKLPVRKITLSFSFLWVMSYSVLVGFSPSVIRSFLFGLVVLLILFSLRSKDTLSIFIFVAFLTLLIWPLLLFDVSFQLSFISVLSILLLVPKFEEIFERLSLNKLPQPSSFDKLRTSFVKGRRGGILIRSFFQIVSASIAVQIGLFPFLVSYFHQISWMTLPANLVLAPFFTLILMPIGFFGMFLSIFRISYSTSFFELAANSLSPFIHFLKWLSHFSWGSSYFSNFSLLEFFLFYSLIFIWFLSPSTRSGSNSKVYFLEFDFSLRIKLFLFLFFCNLLAWSWTPISHYFDSSLRIHFFDVGQGDSMLLELPHGKRILVDAGGIPQSSFDIGEQVILPSLFSKKIKSLDYIILTHPHPDHYGGIKSLLKPFHPKEIWWNGEKNESVSFRELIDEADRLKIPIKKLDQSNSSFEIEGVRFQVLYPLPDLFPANSSNGSEVNNRSLVLRLEYQNFSLLLTGDIEKETENWLVENKKLSPVDLLKVPHHGSQSSSHLDFVSVLKPKVALIGVGRKNWFGFPHSSVLSRYESIGTQIFRTDQMGEINLQWDGNKLIVSSFLKKGEELLLKLPTPADASRAAFYKQSSSEHQLKFRYRE